jgi:hypothetical protein
MVWVPVRNYFALVTAASSGQPAGTVLHGRDDFAVIREDREVWRRMTGLDFAIVWGLDGRPVTRGEAALLLTPRPYEAETLGARTEVRTVDGVERAEVVPCVVLETRTLPPLHPRQIRPETTGAPTMPRRTYEPLAAELGCNACATRARNLLVAPDRVVCDGERNAPPKSPDPARARSPHSLPPPPPTVHARAGQVRPEPAGAGEDGATPVPLR